MKKKTTTKKINFVQSDLLQYIGLTDEEYENQKKQSQITLSAYEAYKKYLFESGTLLWRIKQADKQVIVMNDCDSEQGDFKVRFVFYLYYLINKRRSICGTCFCKCSRTVLPSFMRLNPTPSRYFCPYQAIFIRLMCMITINLNHENKKS